MQEPGINGNIPTATHHYKRDLPLVLSSLLVPRALQETYLLCCLPSLCPGHYKRPTACVVFPPCAPGITRDLPLVLSSLLVPRASGTAGRALLHAGGTPLSFSSQSHDVACSGQLAWEIIETYCKPPKEIIIPTYMYIKSQLAKGGSTCINTCTPPPPPPHTHTPPPIQTCTHKPPLTPTPHLDQPHTYLLPTPAPPHTTYSAHH